MWLEKTLVSLIVMFCGFSCAMLASLIAIPWSEQYYSLRVTSLKAALAMQICSSSLVVWVLLVRLYLVYSK